MIELLMRTETKYLPLSKVTLVKVRGLCDGAIFTITREFRSNKLRAVYYAKMLLLHELVELVELEVDKIDRFSVTSFN